MSFEVFSFSFVGFLSLWGTQCGCSLWNKSHVLLSYPPTAVDCNSQRPPSIHYFPSAVGVLSLVAECKWADETMRCSMIIVIARLEVVAEAGSNYIVAQNQVVSGSSWQAEEEKKECICASKCGQLVIVFPRSLRRFWAFVEFFRSLTLSSQARGWLLKSVF